MAELTVTYCTYDTTSSTTSITTISATINMDIEKYWHGHHAVFTFSWEFAGYTAAELPFLLSYIDEVYVKFLIYLRPS